MSVPRFPHKRLALAANHLDLIQGNVTNALRPHEDAPADVNQIEVGQN